MDNKAFILVFIIAFITVVLFMLAVFVTDKDCKKYGENWHEQNLNAYKSTVFICVDEKGNLKMP